MVIGGVHVPGGVICIVSLFSVFSTFEKESDGVSLSQPRMDSSPVLPPPEWFGSRALDRCI